MTTPHDRWRQIETLFNEVVDLDGAARSARLDVACQDDPALRREIESLLAAYQGANGFLHDLDALAPAMLDHLSPAPSLHPGLRAGRYEVLERLGGGGMGVVYRARDVRLGRPVALKFLPPHLSADARLRARFEHEARTASALNHPNICTIYEIGETEPAAGAETGQLYIAMALYEGETLKKRIERGPLPAPEALSIAAQLAQGLASAHAAGIVHRDVKPANILLTRQDHAVILDFGLAKRGDVRLTRTGTTLGTVAYMSPEQTRGDALDHRTDLWSLGIVLYEMLTGRRPFEGDYDQAVAYAILHEAVPPLRSIRPELPEGAEHVVALCLEKDPAFRYASMDDLADDLALLRSGGDGATASATGTLAAHRRRTRRWRRLAGLGAAGVGLLALLLLLPPVRTLLPGANPTDPAAAVQHVAVLPLLNNLGDTPENQALVDGLTQTLTSMIARLEPSQRPLWVVPAGEVYRSDVATAAAAHQLFGVNTVLEGSVQRLGEQMQLILTLVAPDERAPRIVGTRTVTAPLSPALQYDALDALADLLGLSLGSELRLAAGTGSPARPDAYTFYLRGLGYLQRFDQPGNLDNAARLFTQALEEDPQYALAYAGLCETAWEQYRQTNADALAEEASAYCDQAAALAGDQAAVRVSVGRIYFETGRYAAAEAELERALQLEPDYADAYRWLGWVYAEQGRVPRADAAFREAIRLKPGAWLSYDDYGTFLHTQGRYEDAAVQFEQVRRLTPDNPSAYNALAVIQRDLGDTDEAERLFRQALAIRPSVLAQRNLGRLYFRDGRYDQAVAELEKAQALNEQDWMTWSWLGHAYRWAGDSLRARVAWQRLVDAAEAHLRINPRDDEALILLADAHAALGHRLRARAYLDSLAAHPVDDLQTRYYQARAYELIGDRDRALDYLEQALAGRFDPLTPERDPWLADLRADPRYATLRRAAQAR